MNRYEAKRYVDWGDCDAAGIVFYPNFYRWMDSVFHEMTTSLGFNQRSLQSDFDIFATPLIDTGCRFSSPARYGDRLRIEISLTRLGTSGLTTQCDFFLKSTLVASGHEARVFVKKAGDIMEKTPIPPALRARLEDLLVT